MKPIFISKINNQIIQKGTSHCSSFASDSSFSSFGSNEDNATILILNPNEFTVQPEIQGVHLINHST
jgi:hypothetical protein